MTTQADLDVGAGAYLRVARESLESCDPPVCSRDHTLEMLELGPVEDVDTETLTRVARAAGAGDDVLPASGDRVVVFGVLADLEWARLERDRTQERDRARSALEGVAGDVEWLTARFADPFDHADIVAGDVEDAAARLRGVRDSIEKWDARR